LCDIKTFHKNNFIIIYFSNRWDVKIQTGKQG
jgi:hypothetical protein